MSVAPAPYKRIAAEEAFCPPELLERYRKLIEDKAVPEIGFNSMWGFYLGADSARCRFIRDHLGDLGEARLAHMDAAGIDIAVLALTSPGVQVMSAADGTAFAAYANDWLADAVTRHPDRFAGLAACAPQDPAAAAREIERGVSRLGLKGVIINSHVQQDYLDDRTILACVRGGRSTRRSRLFTSRNADERAHRTDAGPGAGWRDFRLQR